MISETSTMTVVWDDIAGVGLLSSRIRCGVVGILSSARH